MKNKLIGTTVVAVALFAGGVAVGQIAGISGTSAASAVATATTQATPRSPFPAHGSAAHENAEKAVTGSAASQAGAAAVKSVGGGTAGTVTSDFQGDGYEVAVTKSNGSTVEVHLDSSFTVEDGHGGPGGNGGPGAGNPNA